MQTFQDILSRVLVTIPSPETENLLKAADKLSAYLKTSGELKQLMESLPLELQKLFSKAVITGAFLKTEHLLNAGDKLATSLKTSRESLAIKARAPVTGDKFLEDAYDD
jgi:hypothetical protein